MERLHRGAQRGRGWRSSGSASAASAAEGSGTATNTTSAAVPSDVAPLADAPAPIISRHLHLHALTLLPRARKEYECAWCGQHWPTHSVCAQCSHTGCKFVLCERCNVEATELQHRCYGALVTLHSSHKGNYQAICDGFAQFKERFQRWASQQDSSHDNTAARGCYVTLFTGDTLWVKEPQNCAKPVTVGQLKRRCTLQTLITLLHVLHSL